MSFSGMRDLSVRCGFALHTHADSGAASRWSAPKDCNRGTTAIAPLLIVHDESHRLSLGWLLSSSASLRFAGCSQCAMKRYCRSRNFQRTANSVLTLCLSSGGKRKACRRPKIVSSGKCRARPVLALNVPRIDGFCASSALCYQRKEYVTRDWKVIIACRFANHR